MVFLSLPLFSKIRYQNAKCPGLAFCYPKFEYQRLDGINNSGAYALYFITLHTSFLPKSHERQRHVLFSAAASPFEN
jgi:hypothetical protein